MTFTRFPFIYQFAKDVHKMAYPDVRLCPRSGCGKILTGKQTFHSDACRKAYAREGGYSKKPKKVTRIELSEDTSKKIGDHVGSFTAGDYPRGISRERMKEIKDGRATFLTTAELCLLYESFPNILFVILGIRI